MTKIGIIGANGRMGQMLITSCLTDDKVSLAFAAVRAGQADIGKTADIYCQQPPVTHQVPVITSLEDTDFATADIVIDFTRPDLTLDLLPRLAESQTKLVTGTTGFSDAQWQTLTEAARTQVILWGSNMSLGVNMLLGLVEQAAAQLDPEWDIEIIELHHKHKVDAPSGTALSLGEAAAKGRQVSLDKMAVLSREGITGERETGTIGFATVRGGDIVGEHQVILATGGERLELGHRATNRQIFSKGAVTAAKWLDHQSAGKLYTMKDVLSL